MDKIVRKYKPPAVGDPVYLVTAVLESGDGILSIKNYGLVIRRGERLYRSCEDGNEYPIPFVRMGGRRALSSFWALAYSPEDATMLAGEMLNIINRRLKSHVVAASEKYAG